MRILDGRGIVSAVRRREFAFFGVEPADLEGIVSQLKMTEGVEVAIFLYETDNLEYKVSLRSREIVDVSEVASYFGGGGHDIVNNLTLHIEHQLSEKKDQ